MKTTFNPTEALKTIEDVKAFFEYITVELLCLWHPDDDFATYTNKDNNKPAWSLQEARLLNLRMYEANSICTISNVDVYQVGKEVVTRCQGELDAINQPKKKKKCKT